MGVVVAAAAMHSSFVRRWKARTYAVLLALHCKVQNALQCTFVVMLVGHLLCQLSVAGAAWAIIQQHDHVSCKR
jgi:hypothetical protein